MADYDEPISDEEKIKIASNFLTHAPPGEFNEVFNDVRLLLNNDQLLKCSVSAAVPKYNTDQFTPVSLSGVSHPVLLTSHCELDNGRFYDPRSKKSFRVDHLKGEATDIEDGDEDSRMETYRSVVDEEFKLYIEDHYSKGAYAVYCKENDGDIVITVCIEGHKFEPKNYWNGRWRSEWCLTIDNSGGAQVVGILKNQVHYYEDGNVQLVSQKDCKDSISNVNKSDPKKLAQDFVKVVKKAENGYQEAISENYLTMSDTTFKALRRQLPVTRSKVDWNKILGYKIGKELGQ